MSENQDKRPGKPFAAEEALKFARILGRWPRMKSWFNSHWYSFTELAGVYFRSISNFFSGVFPRSRKKEKD